MIRRQTSFCGIMSPDLKFYVLSARVIDDLMNLANILLIIRDT